MIITDEQVQKAFDFLKENAREHAQARANFKAIEKHEKALLARLKYKHSAENKTDKAQEREAYCDPEYRTWEAGYKEALEGFALLENRRENAQIAIEIWRTASANERRL